MTSHKNQFLPVAIKCCYFVSLPCMHFCLAIVWIFSTQAVVDLIKRIFDFHFYSLSCTMLHFPFGLLRIIVHPSTSVTLWTNIAKVGEKASKLEVGRY